VHHLTEAAGAFDDPFRGGKAERQPHVPAAHPVRVERRAGGGGDPGGENPAKRPFYFSWTFHIYPYIEQDTLFKLIPQEGLVDITTISGGNSLLSKLDRTIIPVFLCPTRRAAVLYHNSAVTDFGGNTGTTGAGTGKTDGVIVVNNGPNYVRINIKKITDGTSNTLLLGERRINLRDINSAKDCYDNEPAVRSANDCDVLRRAQAVSGSWLTPGKDIDLATSVSCGHFAGSGICQFGSSHPGGMTAALCDGSVRRIGYGADPRTFKNLCVRHDEQNVDMALLD